MVEVECWKPDRFEEEEETVAAKMERVKTSIMDKEDVTMAWLKEGAAPKYAPKIKPNEVGYVLCSLFVCFHFYPHAQASSVM